MMGRALRWPWAAALVIFSMQTAAQQPEDWKAAMERAESMARAGRVEEAAEAYRRAQETAGSQDERLEAELRLAALLEKSASEQDAEPLAKAAQVYQNALKDPSSTERAGELRLAAQNNYATLLLRQNQPDEAADVLAEIEDEMRREEHAPQRAVYLYNYARALELSGRTEDAVRVYQDAVRADGALSAAARDGSRLVLSSPSETIGIPATVDLVDGLLERGDLSTAGEHMKQACSKRRWASHPDYPELLTSVVQYLAAAKVDAETFDAEWRPILARAHSWSGDAEARRIEQIAEAFRGDLPLIVAPENGDGLGPYEVWRRSARDAEAFSRFLKMLGDRFLSEGEPRRALERYALAWALHPENAEAALYLANLLLERSDDLDPDGEILNRVIARLFESKGQAYLGEDWEDILRLHTVLGTIFERQGRFGPRHDPRSAVFQWEHALDAHERLARSEDSRARTAPGLHENLGNAYAALGDVGNAFREHLTAVEEWLELSQRERAAEALARLSTLDYEPSAEQRETVRRLRSRLR